MSEDPGDVFELMGNGLAEVALDDDFSVTRHNPAFARLLKQPENKPLQRPSMRRLLDNDGFATFTYAALAQDKEKPVRQIETSITDPSGSTRWYSVSITPRPGSALCCFTDITNFKNREYELTQKLGEDEIIFQQSNILTAVYRVASKELILSREASRLYGMPRVCTNFPYAYVQEGWVKGSVQQFVDFYEKIRNGEPSGKASATMQLADGSIRLLNRKFKTVFNPDGSPSHGLISITDITEDRERLLASEKWNYTSRSLKADSIHYYDYNLTTDVLEGIDGNSPSIYPDQNERSFTGVARFVADNIIHPDDRDEYLRIFDRQTLIEKFKNNEQEIITHHRRLKSDGAYMQAEGVIQLFSDPFNGDILCFVLIKDLDSAFERVRNMLKSEIYNLATDTIPGAVILTMNEEDYPYYYVNDGVYALFACPKKKFDEWSGGYAINLIYPEDRKKVSEAVDDAIDNGYNFECECRVLRYDGTIGWVMLRGKKGLSPEGIEVIHSVMTDISEIVTLQHALQDAVADAQAANKTKSVFLANMSHEIRTPMNGIIGLSDIVLDDLSMSPKTRGFAKQIRASANSLLDIINDILDISKIEAGKLELECVDFNLCDTLKECEAITRVKAGDKAIDLDMNIDPGVARWLRGDPTKLRQALLNLLSNAVKFTEHGRVSILVKPVPAEKGIRLRFEVADTGIGMSPEQLEKVFEPFAQADSSTTRKYGGTGLGLSITKTVIEMMGGALKVDSEYGKGTRFSFELGFLPSTKTERDAPASANPENLVPIFAGDVLVCEDNSINQQVIREHLAKVGLKTFLAGNGGAGIEQVLARMRTENPFKLIFMDIHMPVMDGLDATRELKRLGVDTPIIALTANAMASDREKYLQAGMSDYIAKPFNPPELWECLLRHLTPLSMTPHRKPDTRRARQRQPAHDTEVIRRELGLQRSAGNHDLYEHLQADFVRNNRTTLSRLSAAIRSGDRVLAHRIAHSLKSSSALIGAIHLAESANMLETALSSDNENSMENLEKPMKRLDAALRLVLSELAPLVKAHAESASPDVAPMVDRERSIGLLESLKPLLESGDAKSADLLPEVRTVLSPLGGVAERLYDEIDAFDYDLALVTIEEIIRRLDGITAG